MYISDKNLINTLILPYFLATLAEKGIKGKGHDFFEMCKSYYLELIQKYNKVDKIRNITFRLDKLMKEGLLLFVNKQDNIANTHKAIIAITLVAQKALDASKIDPNLQESLLSLFEPFIELEATMNIDVEDYNNIKKSAEKTAEKLYQLFYKE
jgi:septum formation topological specificity factor MinE